jgi:hypothetical protein
MEADMTAMETNVEGVGGTATKGALCALEKATTTVFLVTEEVSTPAQIVMVKVMWNARNVAVTVR